MSDLTPGVRRFRKKPVIVEAIQYLPHDGCAAVAMFMGVPAKALSCADEQDHAPWLIDTLEGVMEASPGDWIIRGVIGEFYPCKPNVFAATYEQVEEQP